MLCLRTLASCGWRGWKTRNARISFARRGLQGKDVWRWEREGPSLSAIPPFNHLLSQHSLLHSLISCPQSCTEPISCWTWTLLFWLQLCLPNPAVGDGKLCSNPYFLEGMLKRGVTVGKIGRKNSHIRPHTESQPTPHILPFFSFKRRHSGGTRSLLYFWT